MQHSPRDTRRAARTLAEAFGPGAKLTTDDDERADRLDRTIGRACALGVLVIVLYLVITYAFGGLV